MRTYVVVSSRNEMAYLPALKCRAHGGRVDGRPATGTSPLNQTGPASGFRVVFPWPGTAPGAWGDTAQREERHA
jgi:hypothetical protein